MSVRNDVQPTSIVFIDVKKKKRNVSRTVRAINIVQMGVHVQAVMVIVREIF